MSALNHWEDPNRMGFVDTIIQRRSIYLPSGSTSAPIEWNVLEIPKDRFQFTILRVEASPKKKDVVDVFLISGVVPAEVSIWQEETMAKARAKAFEEAGGLDEDA